MLTTIAMIHLFVIWFLWLNKKIRTLWKSESYTHINSDNQRCWSFIQHLWFSKIMWCCFERQSSLSAVVSVDISYSRIGRTLKIRYVDEKCSQFFAIKDIYHSTFKLNWFNYKKKIFFVKFFSTFFYKKNIIQNFQFWIDISKWRSQPENHLVLTFLKNLIFSQLKNYTRIESYCSSNRESFKW